MTGRTHILGGVASLWLLPPAAAAAAEPQSVGLLVFCGVIGALLPDLDARHSLLARWSPGAGITPLSIPSRLLHRAFGHRGLLHSLLGLGVAAVLVALPLSLVFGSWEPGAALLLGYASHLALDACTRRGVALLYPSRRRHFLVPPCLRVTTGSPAEEIYVALLTLMVFSLLVPRLFSAAATVG